ncbi:TPA: hypothetical protein ACIHX6_003304 [Salmonella enterica subsp. enterica serovar Typhimurium]
MTQIKTYRVEHEKVGAMYKVRIFGRVGEVISNDSPQERIFREVTIAEGNSQQAALLVDNYIQCLENNGFTTEA